MSAHLTPRDIKSRLDHPLIGADGHRIVYGRVVHEQSPRIGGNAMVLAASAPIRAAAE